MTSPILVAHANCYHPYSFDEALAGIQKAGYTHIELSAVEDWTPHVSIATDEPHAVRERVSDFGLTANAIAAHSDLTSTAGVDYAVRAIAWAAEYGMTQVTTAIGGHGQVDEDLEEFHRIFAPVAQAARQHEVTVALEVHGRLMATGALARPIIERIDSPWVKVKYDTGNCEYYGGVAAVDDFASIADVVVNIDAKDHIGGIGAWNFPPPGEGDIDWHRLAEVVNATSYDGPLTVEIEFVDQVWPELDGVTDALRIARATLLDLFGRSAA